MYVSNLRIVDDTASHFKCLIDLDNAWNALHIEPNVSMAWSHSLQLTGLQPTFVPHVGPPNDIQFANIGCAS